MTLYGIRIDSTKSGSKVVSHSQYLHRTREENNAYIVTLMNHMRQTDPTVVFTPIEFELEDED